MQFLSKLAGLFGRRNSSNGMLPGERLLAPDAYEPLLHRCEGIIVEIKGARDDARAHSKAIAESVERIHTKLKRWDGDGLPATSEEFEALCPSVEALKREEIARAGTAFHFDGESFGPVQMAKEAAKGARAVAGLPCEGKDFSTDAPVFDADHDLQIMGILGVNAKAGWVLVADLPVQLTEHGHIKSRRLRFKKIVQFDRNDQSSGSFHCYGRLPDGKEAA